MRDLANLSDQDLVNDIKWRIANEMPYGKTIVDGPELMRLADELVRRFEKGKSL